MSGQGPLSLPPPDRGALFVVSGPSGAGKSTLLSHVLACVPDLSFSVSATTRAPRGRERDGVDYHFLSPHDFDAAVARGDMLEHATVYEHSYGTPKAPVQEALDAGRSILLDIDVQGSAQVRASGVEAVHVFVLPPDRATLRARLVARGTDAADVIGRRMAQADAQLARAHTYDHLVVNDDLDAARAQLLGIVVAELARTERHTAALQRLLDTPES